jgi:hypothetical protein
MMKSFQCIQKKIICHQDQDLVAGGELLLQVLQHHLVGMDMHITILDLIAVMIGICPALIARRKATSSHMISFVAYRGSEPFSLVLRSTEIFHCQTACGKHSDFFPLLISGDPVPLPSPVRVGSGPVADPYIRREHRVDNDVLILEDAEDGLYRATLQVKAREGFWNSQGHVNILMKAIPCELHVTLVKKASMTVDSAQEPSTLAKMLAFLHSDFCSAFDIL